MRRPQLKVLGVSHVSGRIAHRMDAHLQSVLQSGSSDLFNISFGWDNLVFSKFSSGNLIFSVNSVGFSFATATQ